ncbi:macro domain-containing protein [Nodosilinea sp. LEGE 07088]|uniref:macro domain-containing protein n=1 Tax=Nodosilinea sp. LEGE 07088 TaxID=2777968 RepID=UPI001D135997|nr:macro domain-containing protein [Nodosilinea sp. LEGE 07088]
MKSRSPSREHSLALALEHNICTLAFPAISTGVYGFPLERAAQIAIATVRVGLAEAPTIEQVRLVCFSDHAYQVYQSARS